jgi:hypothetical protein
MQHIPRTVADLFQEEPWQWGMRGDPHLWREMKTALGSSAYPSTEEQLAALLEQTYQQLTGTPLAQREPIYVERYNHGGDVWRLCITQILAGEGHPAPAGALPRYHVRVGRW